MLADFFDTAMLMAESQQVIALRLMKLLKGDKAAAREAQRMVAEKFVAAGEAASLLLCGKGPDSVIRNYRRHVGNNRQRLSRS